MGLVWLARFFLLSAVAMLAHLVVLPNPPGSSHPSPRLRLRESFSCNTYKKHEIPPSSQMSFPLFGSDASLLAGHIFFSFKHGGALSAVMGAAAKRALRLQERRSWAVI